MSDSCLALRLSGPMQSWGISARLETRQTGLMPTRSAVTGLIFAAMGIERGSDEERKLLMQCASLHMHVFRDSSHNVRRLRDYQTYRFEDSKTKYSFRFYVTDTWFVVFLTGDHDLLERIANALKDPVWGIYLGRKCCPPTAPVFAGLFASEEDAHTHCLISSQTYEQVEDADSFSEGNDSICDMPLSFAPDDRRFCQRRVINRVK